MKILFIQGGSRVRITEDNNYYVDGNFNNNIWKRYKKYCDELNVILRKIDSIYDKNELERKFNKIDTNICNLNLVKDVYRPKFNIFNLKLKNEIKKAIEYQVKINDRIIIRSLGNFYTNTALKYCKKYNKKYLIEVTGFGFEGMWYHSLLGKFCALKKEMKMKKEIKKAPYVLYVTDRVLQKRYPTKGINIGCSDVEIYEEDVYSSLQKNKNKEKKVIGTIGWLDVKYKGQQNVIKALFELKQKGYNNIYYEILGSGNPLRLQKIINKYSMEKEIKILSSRSHDEVLEWLKKIDIYIHPSFSEGLCRSIVEAMSVGCPIIASKVGGNVELINSDFLYNYYDIHKLEELIVKMIDEKILNKESITNYNMSKKFKQNQLEIKREYIYREFIKE